VYNSALLDGVPTMADALLASCRGAISEFIGNASGPDSDLAIDRFLRNLEAGASSRKSAIIDHHVRMRLGMEYADLRRIPLTALADVPKDIWDEVERLHLGSDLIVCSVTDEPVIVRLDTHGSVHWEHNYSATGEAADIARAVLCQLPWTKEAEPGILGTMKKPPLMECLYRVYEAKYETQMARRSSVGESTAFRVLTSKDKFDITLDCWIELKETYNDNHNIPKIKFQPDFLVKEEDRVSRYK
jgi:hypothetical protein